MPWLLYQKRIESPRQSTIYHIRHAMTCVKLFIIETFQNFGSDFASLIIVWVCFIHGIESDTRTSCYNHCCINNLHTHITISIIKLHDLFQVLMQYFKFELNLPRNYSGTSLNRTRINRIIASTEHIWNPVLYILFINLIG